MLLKMCQAQKFHSNYLQMNISVVTYTFLPEVNFQREIINVYI